MFFLLFRYPKPGIRPRTKFNLPVGYLGALPGVEGAVEVDHGLLGESLEARVVTPDGHVLGAVDHGLVVEGDLARAQLEELGHVEEHGEEGDAEDVVPGTKKWWVS